MMIEPKTARLQSIEIDRGPLGDARPDNSTVDPRANPSLPQEQVEDRENVSIVTPEDYPLEDRKISRPK
jgi:hypothetical protein